MSSNIRIHRICKYCGNEFVAKTTTTNYCSLKCNQRDYKRRTKQSKIAKSNQETKTTLLQISEDLQNIDTKPYLSIKEVSMLLGLSRTTLYRLVKNKKIKASKIGKRVIFKKANIEKLFEES